jgi:TonB family protein
MTLRITTVLFLFSLLAAAQVQIPPSSAPQHVLAGLRSKDARTRAETANDLGAMRAKNAVRGLAELLTDKDAKVREAAAFALGQISDRAAARLLIPLLADKDVEVRSTTAFSLGMLGDRKGIDALSFAVGDTNAEVRSSALVGLGLMQDEGGIDEITGLLDDSSFDVRYDAAWALGQVGEPESEEHLRGALVTIDLLKISDSARAAFQQCVQNSIDDLRTVSHRIASEQSSRPRRVSGVVSENRYGSQSRPVAVRKSVRPMATERAINAGISGSVKLRVLVEAGGRAVRAYVVRRLGYGLDQRAVQAVMQYRFDPALQSGLPQTTWVELEVKY